MTATPLSTVTAFRGDAQLASGPLRNVALAVKVALERDAETPILVFDDATGRVVDLDLRGTGTEILARLEEAESETAAAPKSGRSVQAAQADRRPRGRGRPALGVISREVTLLPRHWEWLAGQPRSASATLRRLVDTARHAGAEQESGRRDRDAAYRFMSAMAGNLPGFEEAARALFAGERDRLEQQMTGWPRDLRRHTLKLAFGDMQSAGAAGGGARPTATSKTYLEPTPEAARALIQRGISGPVTMLNLLRLRQTADYSQSPDLAPAEPISGAEAFERYVAHTLPFLEASGGDLLFIGEGGGFLIGPEDRRWDRVMLVRQSSIGSFLAFAQNPDYLAGLGHRTAAVEDSRLLPVVETPRAD